MSNDYTRSFEVNFKALYLSFRLLLVDFVRFHFILLFWNQTLTWRKNASR